MSSFPSNPANTHISGSTTDSQNILASADEIRASDDAAHAHEEGAAMTPKRIWLVFWILLGITTIEFIITLYLVHTFHWSTGIKGFVLIALTLLKAYYIVGYFMHLKFERTPLIYIIAMPTILILGLIAGLVSEGHHWLLTR
jgi:cytochrome c oxidase subunit IV